MLLGKLLPLLCADSSPVLQHTSGLRLGIRLKQVLTLGMSNNCVQQLQEAGSTKACRGSD